MDICGPCVVILLNRTPKRVVDYTHHKDMCYDGIKLCDYNIDIIMGLIMNEVDRVRGSM